jgi:hypothetical protein
MDFIKTLVKLLPAGAAIFACAWFVQFQFNPYKWCEDHPDPEKTKDYYLCEPFGFDLKKGLIDRGADNHMAGENRVIYGSKTKTPNKKAYNCDDSNVLMTKDGYDYCMGNH